MFCSLITAGALTSTDTYQFNPRAAQHTEADKPVQASLPCWQQHPKAFKRQSRAQQTLGKSPSETLPCARLRTQLLLTAPPASSLGRRCAGILAHLSSTSKSLGSICCPVQVPPPAPLPTTLCKAVLQAPRLEGVGGVGTPKPPQVVPVGVTPTLSPLQPPAPSTAFKREAKRSAPASREELLCPREEQRSLCTFHPGCRFRRITQAQESSSRRGSRAPCAAVGWQQMFVTSGPPWRPRPRTMGSVPTSPPQTPEPPKVPDWDMAPQGTLPLTRVSVSKWAALLHAHGMCFP